MRSNSSGRNFLEVVHTDHLRFATEWAGDALTVITLDVDNHVMPTPQEVADWVDATLKRAIEE